MRNILAAAIFSIICFPAFGDTESTDNSISGAVVKVFTTVRYPDYFKPWTKLAPTEYTGTGVVIEGKRILSNAHLVSWASEVQIQSNQNGDKISATVEYVSPGMDLAILKLDDESFFDTHPPLPRAATLPDLQDTVAVYGYPRGGTGLSITKGIVSRIEFASYNFPQSGLRIQIDAAINPGNSGGPVVSRGEMVGLAFSTLVAGQNIGYAIPNEEIEMFMKDVRDGHYDGKPMLMDGFQVLENPALRAYLKLDKEVKGVIVKLPAETNSSYPLKQWDVVTKIADYPVDDQGLVKVDRNLRTAFRYLVPKVAKKGKVQLTLLRSGKEMVVDVPVTNRVAILMPYLDGAYPPYFVYGPIAFSKASGDLISYFTRITGGSTYLSSLIGTGSPMVTRYGKKLEFEGEELVIVSSPFFPHKLTKGYLIPTLNVVESVNGHRIKNLEHLVKLLRDSKDEFISIDFANHNTETLVFPRKDMVAATDDILAENGLRNQGSSDMMAIWKRK